MAVPDDAAPPETAHVHGELVLYDTRDVLARLTRALRDLHLVGVVVHEELPARTLGLVHVTLATAPDAAEPRALRAGATGLEAGPTLDDLAQALRSRLAASVVFQDCSGNELVATVPPVIAERMTEAMSEPVEVRHVYVLPAGTDASDVETWAMFVGGPTTLTHADDRPVLVGTPRRPSGFPLKDGRPLVQLMVQEDQFAVGLWSRHAIRWTQALRRRMGAQSNPDVTLSWSKEPIRLVGDAGPDAYPAPSSDAARAAERTLAPSGPTIRGDLTRLLERVVAELDLDPGVTATVLDLATAPWAPDLPARVGELLGVPADAVALAVGTIDVGTRTDAVSASPSGLMARALERRFNR